jgi:hypothetical protein
MSARLYASPTPKRVLCGSHKFATHGLLPNVVGIDNSQRGPFFVLGKRGGRLANTLSRINTSTSAFGLFLFREADQAPPIAP